MTIENVVFISREEFEAREGSNKDIFISIHGYWTDEEHQAKPKGEWKDGIFLKFDDIDYPNHKSFDDDMAFNVLNFIIDHHQRDEGLNLVVHCFAGISRSAAVAKFVNENFAVRKNHSLSYYTLYNKYVYKMLRQEFFGTFYGPEKN